MEKEETMILRKMPIWSKKRRNGARREEDLAQDAKEVNQDMEQEEGN